MVIPFLFSEFKTGLLFRKKSGLPIDFQWKPGFPVRVANPLACFIQVEQAHDGRIPLESRSGPE